jgi:hypothetical protein
MSTFADPYNTEAVERQKDFAREKAREEREKMAKRAMNNGMEIGRVKDDLHTTTGSCSTVYGDCVGDDAQIMDEFKDNHDNWDKTLSKNTPDAEQRTTTDSKTKQQFQTTYKADSSYQRPETHNPNIFTHTKRNFFTITSLFNFGKKMPYSTTSTNAALSDHQKINPQPSGPKFSEPTSSSTSTDSARAKTHMNGTSPGSKTGGANSTSANVDSKIRGVKTGTTVDIDAKTAAVSGSSIDFGEKGRNATPMNSRDSGEKGRNASPTSSGDLGEKDRTVTPTTSGNLGEKGRNANPTSSGDSNRTRDTHSTSSTVNSTSPTTVDSFARNVDTASINQGVHGTGKASKKVNESTTYQPSRRFATNKNPADFSLVGSAYVPKPMASMSGAAGAGNAEQLYEQFNEKLKSNKADQKLTNDNSTSGRKSSQSNQQSDRQSDRQVTNDNTTPGRKSQFFEKLSNKDSVDGRITQPNQQQENNPQVAYDNSTNGRKSQSNQKQQQQQQQQQTTKDTYPTGRKTQSNQQSGQMSNQQVTNDNSSFGRKPSSQSNQKQQPTSSSSSSFNQHEALSSIDKTGIVH